MPQTKDYEGKKKHVKGKHPHHSKEHKRRLHRDMMQASEGDTESTMEESSEMMADEAINTEAQNEGVHASEATSQEEEMSHNGHGNGHAHSESTTEEQPREKIHLEFYGSELIRQKAPKVMEFADVVADEWVHDGQFEGLPVGNPLAQMAAAKALRTAKDVEKKLEEKGVIAMAKMGLDYVKSKIEKKNH